MTAAVGVQLPGMRSEDGHKRVITQSVLIVASMLVITVALELILSPQ